MEIFVEQKMILFCIGLIIVGSSMLSYAFSLQQMYNNAPSKCIDPYLEGFELAQNETEIRIDFLMVVVLLEPRTLAFSYQFELQRNGTYYIFLKFPFRITKVNNCRSIPLHADFQLINNQTRGSSLLFALVNENSNKIDEMIEAEFSIEETFISGRRGEYLVNLRFTYEEAMGSVLLEKMGFNITEEPAIVRYVNASAIKNFVLILAYPERLTITYAFPQFTVGPVVLYESNSTGITWFYEELDPRELSFVVYYKDSAEYDSYQLILFSSGIWYGLSFSVIITAIFEFIRTILSLSSRSALYQDETKHELR
jgi:hypothetical protein